MDSLPQFAQPVVGVDVDQRTAISVAYGDGIGPEIMQASLRVLTAAGAQLRIEPVEMGESVYLKGTSAGIDAAAWDSIRRTGVLFKAPISTPQGGGYKSLNVTLRKSLGLYANVRPCVGYHPVLSSLHPTLDVTIVRENEEDLYAGVEHRQTEQMVQCLKLISRPGCERIVRYAFEYARANGRRKVSCFGKDNIMKLTDGLFHTVFNEIGAEYPEIEKDYWIIDIGAARLAAKPQTFDVIVTTNLYGDIVSDIAAEVAGSVGLAPSANIGPKGAMFEAIHGSAPALAGLDAANPSGLLLAGVMMLVHLGQGAAAARVHNALLRTLEDGIHTADIAGPATLSQVGTRAFADAVIARLGLRPQRLAAVDYGSAVPLTLPAPAVRTPAKRQLVGVDVFVHEPLADPEALAARLLPATAGVFRLSMISNRGVKVWPQGLPETTLTDHWRCRFEAVGTLAFNRSLIIELLGRLNRLGIEFIKTEGLYTFDGQPGYTLGQGQ